MIRAVRAVRPTADLRPVEGPEDELVLHGGGEVFRLPRSPEAAERIVLCTRVLPRLRPLVPVPVPAPRLVGVLDDGLPFSAEPRLPGVRPDHLDGIALGQLDGLLAALADVPVREAREWGLSGDGVLRHGRLSVATVLVDARRGVLTGVVGWAPELGEEPEASAVTWGA